MNVVNQMNYNLLDRYDDLSSYTDVQQINYRLAYSLYSYWLCQYLIKKVSLNKYDIMVENDFHHFLPIMEEEKDVYQLLNNNLLKFFYVRNTLHLLNLTNEEMNFVFSKVANNDFSFNDKIYEFMDNSFRKVIKENVEKINDNAIETNYGPESEQFFAPYDALVLGFRYNEFDSTGMNEDEWLDNHIEQYQFLEDLFSEMEKNISKDLKIPCKIIKYDDYSVMLNDDLSTDKKIQL